MIFYTLRKVKDAWSLFILLPAGGSLSGEFDNEQQARSCIWQFLPRTAELTEAEMWRETMRREMAVAV